MIDLADIRAVATPKEVAKYFLGMPSYERGKSLWYCSPFREETHPSFKVDDIGMYDFGNNQSYNIFEFVQKIKQCSFKESVDVLASMFGVSDRDYEDKSLIEWYKKQKEEKAKHQREVQGFYMSAWNETDAEYRMNQELLELFKPKKVEDLDSTYKKLIDEQVSINGMKEYLAQYCNTWEEKEKLMQKAMKGDLPTWLMDRLKVRMMASQTLHIERMQKREY